MYDTFTFHYDEENGEVLVLSPDEGLHETVQEIYSIIYNNHTEVEIMSLKNGLSISVPVFIEYFFPIIEILRHVNHGISFTDEGIGIINKVREIVETEDVFRKPLTKEDIKNNKFRNIADFISGMTDRFAIKLHKNI